MSVIDWVQFDPGQPGAPGIGDCGGCVVTLKTRLPFLISEKAGKDAPPLTLVGAGLPAGWLRLPRRVRAERCRLAPAEMLMKTSPLPRLTSVPDAVRVRPLSVNVEGRSSP